VTFQEVNDFIPKILPINVDWKKIEQVMNYAKETNQWVLCFIIGTKPCINKFFGAVKYSSEKKLPVMVIDSNQHYDATLTKGLEEFGYLDKISVNLNIRGDLNQKSGELFFKLKWLASALKKKWPNITAIPVINGDVIVAAIAPAAWMFARGEKGVNMEAGMRSMSPSSFRKLKSKELTKKGFEDFVQGQFNEKWELLPIEPFPEQWDTYVSSKGCQFNFAPLNINKQNLLREGYPEKYVPLANSGVVIDAWKFLKNKKPEQSIFELYPQLEKDSWIRVDIHRKENLNPVRFKSLIGGIKKLVDKGHNINLIGMNATKHALKNNKLTSVVEKLKEKKNFLYTDLWPEFSQVREFYKSEHNLFPLTDSGGVQEDMNYWRKPCLTARFSTDRPETGMESKSNLLVPPISPELVYSVVHNAVNDEILLNNMANAPYLYGEGFGKTFANKMKEYMKNEKPFTWTHEELGLWKDKHNTDF